MAVPQPQFWQDLAAGNTARPPGKLGQFPGSTPGYPDLLFLAATLVQLYRSADGGDTWTALPRRLEEVRGIAWMPGRPFTFIPGVEGQRH